MLLVFLTFFFGYAEENFTVHEVRNLPFYSGKDSLPFKHYTGYGEVNSNATMNKRRYLFYWFTLSQRNPKTDPVILWLNGGPGCSSLEDGPFTLSEDGTDVELNPHSWNKNANVIFLEQPAGVGYSYSKDTSDYKTCNDNRTADDAFEFLEKFFTVGFPQFLENDFYIAGESYGGHYVCFYLVFETFQVTVIARRINEALHKKEGVPLNLVGYAIGNGCTDDENEFNSWPLYWSQHALIPQAQYDQAWDLCDHDFFHNRDKKDCGDALDAMWDVFTENIYGECYGLRNPNANRYAALANVPSILRRLYPRKVERLNSLIPCVNTDNLKFYFNNDEVISAINARLTETWEECSDIIGEYYDDVWTTMIPFHEELLKDGYKVLFYSGDIDGGIDTLGTEASIDVLMPAQKNIWNRWYTYNPTKQVGGFFKNEGKLSFVTVRGSGHMVPQDRPYEIKQVMDRWINDEPF